MMMMRRKRRRRRRGRRRMRRRRGEGGGGEIQPTSLLCWGITRNCVHIASYMLHPHMGLYEDIHLKLLVFHEGPKHVEGKL